MTKSISKRVFGLWPSIGSMAGDLGVPPSVLIECREAGSIPDAKHDGLIVARALYEGVSLTGAQLQKARKAEKNKEKMQQIIADFVGRAGGPKTLGEKIGATENVIRLSASRGYLPRRRKYEFMEVAGELNFTMPDEVFDTR